MHWCYSMRGIFVGSYLPPLRIDPVAGLPEVEQRVALETLAGEFGQDIGRYRRHHVQDIEIEFHHDAMKRIKASTR